MGSSVPATLGFNVFWTSVLVHLSFLILLLWWSQSVLRGNLNKFASTWKPLWFPFCQTGSHRQCHLIPMTLVPPLPPPPPAPCSIPTLPGLPSPVHFLSSSYPVLTMVLLSEKLLCSPIPIPWLLGSLHPGHAPLFSLYLVLQERSWLKVAL